METGKLSRRDLIRAGIGAATTSLIPDGLFGTTQASEIQKGGGNSNAKASGDPEGKTDVLKAPFEHVNVLFGTASLDDPALIGNAPPYGEELYTGMVCPGAARPHGIDLSPVNKDISLAYPHGNLYSYIYPRRTLVGFSSMVDDMLLMPLVGDWTTPPDRIRYASVYDKTTERSVPGHYFVYLRDHRIKVDLTTTELCGLYRFIFPQTDRATILLDLGPNSDSSVEFVGDRIIQGKTQNGKVCFVIEFSKPCHTFGTFHRNPSRAGMIGYPWFLPGMDEVRPNGRTDSGSYAGCFLTYHTGEGEQLFAKISSAGTVSQTRKTLAAEIPDWGLETIRRSAADSWKDKLNLIQVKGGTEKQRAIFYSCLYHAFASPRLVARRGDEFTGLDGEMRIAQHDRYDKVPYWDTGRNQVVLLTLLEPEVKVNILRSQLEMAKEAGWMGTSFHGDHAVAMYLGDWERGLSFDYESVYPYLYRNATDPKGPRNNLAEYLKNGWVHDVVVEHPSPPYYGGNAGVSKTLEYCYDDFCLAIYARKLGKTADERMFMSRARNYRNVWDSKTEFMRGRMEAGSWIAPFHPMEPYYNYMYKESNAWQTTWFVPHDVKGLIDLMGGREKFVARLDEFFSVPYAPRGIARDVTGMIGQYCHGNEPDHQSPYFYNWAGAPWKTQEVVRKILRLMYGSDRAGLGLAGMDDNGENSAWYVLSAMGFYTVDPARAEYILGSPIFDQITIHLDRGRDFRIQANHNSERNIYIQSAILNGKELNRPWFRHSDIANGGTLVLEMGPVPNTNWGSAPTAAPPSMSD